MSHNNSNTSWLTWVQQRAVAHPYSTSVVAGLFLGMGFVWPLVWWVYGVGLVILIWQLQSSPTWLRAIVHGGVAWTVSAACALWWLWAVYPVQWMDVPQGMPQLVFIGANWFTSALWIGLAGGFFGLVVWLAIGRRSVSALVSVPIVAIAWVIAEMLGSVAFSIFTLGGESFINVRFSFGYVGYHLAQHDWLFHLSIWGGVYILSFVAVLLPLLLWRVYCAHRSHAAYGAAVLGLVVGFGYGTSSYMFVSPVPEQGITVAIVDTFRDGQVRATGEPAGLHASLRDAVTAAAKQQPDYILLPEDARYLERFSNQTERQFVLDRQFGDTAVRLIDSGSVMTSDGLVLRGYVYDHGERATHITDKQYLVPQGEYIPAFHATVAQVTGYGKVVETMRQKIQYVPGPADQQINDIAAPALLFCFESASPYGVRHALAQQEHEAPFVAHPISHAWFHTPTQLWHQLDTMVRIQARWNSVPIISAGNMVPGRMYTPAGQVLAPEDVLYAPDGDWRIGRWQL